MGSLFKCNTHENPMHSRSIQNIDIWPKPLSTAASALVIWLSAYVTYWQDRGLVFECDTWFYCL